MVGLVEGVVDVDGRHCGRSAHAEACNRRATQPAGMQRRRIGPFLPFEARNYHRRVIAVWIALALLAAGRVGGAQERHEHSTESAGFFGYFVPLTLAVSHVNRQADDAYHNTDDWNLGGDFMTIALGLWLNRNLAIAGRGEVSFRSPLLGWDGKLVSNWYPWESVSLEIGFGWAAYQSLGTTTPGGPTDPLRGPVGHVGAGFAWGSSRADSGITTAVEVRRLSASQRSTTYLGTTLGWRFMFD